MRSKRSRRDKSSQFLWIDVEPVFARGQARVRYVGFCKTPHFLQHFAFQVFAELFGLVWAGELNRNVCNHNLMVLLRHTESDLIDISECRIVSLKTLSIDVSNQHMAQIHQLLVDTHVDARYDAFVKTSNSFPVCERLAVSGNCAGDN